MKKIKCTTKKISLNKLQMVKITSNLNSIRGGGGQNLAIVNGDNDTVLDNTYTHPKGQDGGIQN